MHHLWIWDFVKNINFSPTTNSWTIVYKYTAFMLFFFLLFPQIQSKPVFAAAADAPKVVWRGWLTCVNGDPEYLRSLPPDFVSLPLFCTSGPESLTTLVKSWFERAFDCNFGSLALNSTTLNWLAALWTGCHPTCNIRYLKLAWSLPTQPPLDVSYTVNPQDAWELWNSIHSEESTDDRIDIKEVQSLMNGLETHFFRHFKIYLSAGTLVKVSTALGSAQLDGKIKVIAMYLFIVYLAFVISYHYDFLKQFFSFLDRKQWLHHHLTYPPDRMCPS